MTTSLSVYKLVSMYITDTPINNSYTDSKLWVKITTKARENIEFTKLSRRINIRERTFVVYELLPFKYHLRNVTVA